MQTLLAQLNPAGLVPPDGNGTGTVFGSGSYVPPNSGNIQVVPEPSFLLGFIFLVLISLLIKKRKKLYF